jgi:hypothetical protein
MGAKTTVFAVIEGKMFTGHYNDRTGQPEFKDKRPVTKCEIYRNGSRLFIGFRPPKGFWWMNILCCEVLGFTTENEGNIEEGLPLLINTIRIKFNGEEVWVELPKTLNCNFMPNCD